MLVNILMLGDVAGSPGMSALFLGLQSLIKKYKVDFCVVNGENAAGGFGISEEDYYNIKKYGADVITSGNHIWQKSEIYPLLDSKDDLLRPLNYPKGVMGHGLCTVKKNGVTYSVISLQGRVDMPVTDCPFKSVKETIEKIKKTSDVILVDFHAESSLEKEAMGFFLDGSVSAIVGTHTHIQTMDEKILPKGSGYITDLGLTGVHSGVIGSNPDISIERQLTQIPMKSEIADEAGEIQGVLLTVDTESGLCTKIVRI